MKYLAKNIQYILIGLLLVLVGSWSLAAWLAIQNQPLEVGTIESWNDLPVPEEAFAHWSITNTQAQGIKAYRDTFIYVTGRTEEVSMKEFIKANNLKLIEFSEYSNPILSDNLADAVSHLQLEDDARAMLGRDGTYEFIGQVNNKAFVSGMYDSVSNTFIATIIVFRHRD